MKGRRLGKYSKGPARTFNERIITLLPERVEFVADYYVAHPEALTTTNKTYIEAHRKDLAINLPETHPEQREALKLNRRLCKLIEGL